MKKIPPSWSHFHWKNRIIWRRSPLDRLGGIFFIWSKKTNWNTPLAILIWILNLYRAKHLTQEEKRGIIQLTSQGLYVAEISRKIDWSRQAISWIIQDPYASHDRRDKGVMKCVLKLAWYDETQACSVQEPVIHQPVIHQQDISRTWSE